MQQPPLARGHTVSFTFSSLSKPFRSLSSLPTSLLQALLSLVCDTAKTSGSSGHPNRLLLSLYAVLVCELLVAAPQVRLLELSRLLNTFCNDLNPIHP